MPSSVRRHAARTPVRRKYFETKRTWVWNREGVIVGMIYAIQLLLLAVAEMYLGHWIMRPFILLSVLYTGNEWNNWKDMFAWRLMRSHPDCKSHTMRPNPGNGGHAHKRFQRMPSKLGKEEFFAGTPVGPTDTPAFHADSSSSNDKTKFHSSMGCPLSARTCQGRCCQRAEKPDMDHIYLTFSDYLWCSWFVLPFMELGMFFGARTGAGVFGVLWNRAKEFLGWNEPYNEKAVEQAIVDVMLSFSLLVWADVEGSVVTYKIPAMTHIDAASGFVEAGEFVLKVDMESREFIGGSFKGDKISPAASLGLLMNAFAGHTHPLLHGYASWGVNVNAVDWFIRRMSVITVKFNNLGVQGWPNMIDWLSWLGLCKTPLTKENTMLSIFLNHNVPDHAGKMHMMKNLPYVKFVIEVRKFFMEQFELFEEDFEDMDAEALFVGTVLHSIDHRVVAKYFAKPLLAAEAHVEPKFAADLEWGLWTCNLVTDAPRGRPYENHFHNSHHPLFRNTYQFAKKINPELAGFMEACIAI